MLISVIIYIVFTSYWQLFTGYILMGVSFAFRSGAREALIYDTLKEKKLHKHNSKILGQLDFLGSTFSIAGVIIGSFIYKINQYLPFMLEAFVFVIAIFFLFLLKEPKYKKHYKKLSFSKSFVTGIKIVFKNPVILSLLLLYVPLFFFEEGWHIVKQPLLVSIGLPLTLLGFYYALNRGFFALGGLFLPKLLKKFSHKTLLLFLIIIECVIWLIFGTNNLYAIIIFSYLVILIHQFWNYIDADIVHKHIPSHIRATTLSARQMIISFIWIFNPWFLGYLLDTFNRNYLFPIFGLIVLVIAGLVFLIRRKYY